MFTYGYIREATMAHLDTDENEAQAMNLLSRFHIYANEAMQAICSSKPLYKYIDITVVTKFAPLVMDGAFFRPATVEELEDNVPLATNAQTENYYHERGIYLIYEVVPMSDTFIAFADKKAFKIVNIKPSIAEVMEAEMRGITIPTGITKLPATSNDYTYIGKNQLMFLKEGRYLIPGRFAWYRFDSGLSDSAELDMPFDILVTIPLYIASVCLQIDNMQKSQIIRQEYELALSRCTATDFMELNSINEDY